MHNMRDSFVFKLIVWFMILLTIGKPPDSFQMTTIRKPYSSQCKYIILYYIFYFMYEIHTIHTLLTMIDDKLSHVEDLCGNNNNNDDDDDDGDGS